MLDVSLLLDAPTVRFCAKKVLNNCLSFKSENTRDVILVSRNQAFLTYHSLMQLIEPQRDMAKSIEEARKLRPDE
ncbi:MAG TPA: hypothetical protein VNX68_19090 [Nitrosopumilaceae archaeon]|jgi:hypothetical protein|nr:hypothetical protein [Nitrosopumilaceae archaeon]